MAALEKIISHGLLVMTLVSGNFSYAQGPVAPEYQVKAVFLFHFTQFVEWPSTAFASADSPLIIGVLGENPFNSYLQETVSGENVNGRTINIEYYKNIGELKKCHVLFINKTEASSIAGILDHIKGESILTVSDASSFLEQGGMIRFFNKDNKIQIQVNLDAAKNANLDISSKLLRLAEIFAAHKVD